MPQRVTRRTETRGRPLELHARTPVRRPCAFPDADDLPRGIRGRFRVTVEAVDADSVAVTLAGELDIAVLPALDQALRRAQRTSPLTVFVDAADVNFVDLSAVRRLAGAHDLLKEHGGELLIVHPPECLVRILDVLEDLELLLLP